ncbi:MAG: NTP transferase domain-containing protein [Actinophytocola sp.]|nr:NTP transferase domain-containing protein [Actinophytocola sp.]
MTSDRFPAVVTAAGAGIRFRPFTSVVPKEMLPVGPVPAIEHVIRECLSAGATDVITVTRPDDDIVPGYVARLQQEGLPVIAVPEDLGHGYGNAAPLLTVRDQLSGCHAFAVAFGDDVLLGEPPAGFDIATMRAQLLPGIDGVVAGQRIDPSRARSFGIIDTHPDDSGRVIGIRQRPEPSTVTDPLAVVSRLVLRPAILDLLKPSDRAGGEVDLGIAVGELAAHGHVSVHPITRYWVTVGDPLHYRDAIQTYWNTVQHHQPPANPENQ